MGCSSSSVSPKAEAAATIVAGGQTYKSVGTFTSEASMQAVLDDPEKFSITYPSDAQNEEERLIVIIGSGYHRVNGISPTPEGVSPDGGAIDTEATLQGTIDSIQQGTSVKIRKNPLDKEAKQIQSRLQECADELEKKELSQLQASLAEKYKSQLEEEKTKLISWLNSLSKNPKRDRIAFVRNSKLKDTDIPAKPSWAVGVMNEQNLKPERNVLMVLDFGTGKVAATMGDGTQPKGFNRKYDNEGYDHQNYIDDVKSAFDGEIIARLTGGFRKPDSVNKTQELISRLQKNGIQAELLPIEKEAEYASQHALSIVSGYFPDIKYITVVEYGGGSHQGQHFLLLGPGNN